MYLLLFLYVVNVFTLDVLYMCYSSLPDSLYTAFANKKNVSVFPIGAFLVPYGLLAVVCGIPLFLLETSVGQFTQGGFITCWSKLCPLAQGELK